MTRTILLLACALPLLATGGCANSDATTAESTSRQDAKTVALGVTSAGRTEHDEAVTFELCPAAVQKTIEAYVGEGSIVEIERTTDHGEVLYEVDARIGDGIAEFDVAEDGAFRGWEGDDDDGDDEDDEGDDEEGEEYEEEIPLSEVPDHVKEAAVEAVAGLVLEEATRELEGDAVVYELEGEVNGEEYEIEVSADGEVLEIELDEDDDNDGDDDDDDDDEREDDD